MRVLLSDWSLVQRGIEEEKTTLLEKRARLSGRDSILQNIRRIDWRFLLPDPHLQRVALLGSSEGTLLKALKEFSDNLTIISSEDLRVDEENSQPDVDLVVLHSGRTSDLKRANSRLVKGGYVYWEIDRRSSLRSLREMISRHGWAGFFQRRIWLDGLGLDHFRRYVTSLERLGFGSIRVYWHRPNFESCLEIIPMDDPVALNYVFSRSSGKISGRLKTAIGRSLMKNDVLGQLVPCLSLIAHKPLA